jgi:hypothetical protein
MVQLANGTKRKVIEVKPACQFIMNEFPTQETPNMLPLGCYGMLIGIDWLATHKSNLDCYNKTMECEDEKGKKRVLQGIHKHDSVRKVSSLQVNNYCRKRITFI